MKPYQELVKKCAIIFLHLLTFIESGFVIHPANINAIVPSD